MGDDCVLEFYGNPGSTVHLVVIFCPIKSRIRRETARRSRFPVYGAGAYLAFLSEFMNRHQVEWRENNVSSTNMGTWQGDPYPWIVPRNLWEEGLWPGIRTGSDDPLTTYLKRPGVQKHSGVHNLKSSSARRFSSIAAIAARFCGCCSPRRTRRPFAKRSGAPGPTATMPASTPPLWRAGRPIRSTTCP